MFELSDLAPFVALDIRLREILLEIEQNRAEIRKEIEELEQLLKPKNQ